MVRQSVRELGVRALAASKALALLSTEVRNSALLSIADRLDSAGDVLWEANRADIKAAKEAGVAAPLLDRATLTPAKLAGMAQGCRAVAALPDPLGELFEARTLPNGLRVAKKRVPLGVMAVIFESRPNVTIDIGALGIKTGNAVIMRGGRESLQTNVILANMVREACSETGVPEDAVQLITSTDRSLVPELLGMDDIVDFVIPRGGPGLQAMVKEHARMPVIYGGIGVCHLFVDVSADLERSVAIIHNAKTQAPSVCNALDTVLVHEDIASDFMPMMVSHLVGSGVRVLCDEASYAFVPDSEELDRTLVDRATTEDYGREFLSLAFSVKVVASLDEAIEHIDRYSTRHSDGILTNDYAHATRFTNEVNSAAVFVNASTRFNDGGEFGLGAEVAISTQKMHARGPMGPKELTTYKWVVQGNWHYRK